MFSDVAGDLILRSVRDGLWLVIFVSGPVLLVSVVVGLFISLFQAATQIQDQTISFVPKLIAVVVAIVALGPLLAAQVARFAQHLLLTIPTIH